ncbi:MAG: hypothetical protein IKJ32_04060 [Clostridia bacterium]|nr:hypothetical protein [Clostridia bacterium]
MSKVYEYLFIMIALISGVSIGLYTGISYNPKANISLEVQDVPSADKEVVRPVQDIVISKVQDEKDVVEVVMSEVKITPYTQLVIKKNYKKCGHDSLDAMTVPIELINFSKDDLQEKYEGWEIEMFSEEQVILSRNIDSNCDEHYMIKEEDGKVFVYKELTENKLNLLERLDLNIELLAEEDRESLKSGVKLYGSEDLANWKENYTS